MVTGRRARFGMFACATWLIALPCASLIVSNFAEAAESPTDWRKFVQADHEARKSRLETFSDAQAGAVIEFFEYTIAMDQLPDAVGVDLPVLRIVFPQQVFFDSGSADIRNDATGVLMSVAQELAEEERSIAVFVAGHTDSVGSSESNNVLSTARAGAVARSVEADFENASIWQVGFGESLPLVPNTSSANRGINRRVEFVVAAKQEAVAVWLANQHDIICSEAGGEVATSCMRGVEATKRFEAVQVKAPTQDADEEGAKDQPERLTIDAESRTVDRVNEDGESASQVSNSACSGESCWSVRLIAVIGDETVLLGQGGLEMASDDTVVRIEMGLGSNGKDGSIVQLSGGQAYFSSVTTPGQWIELSGIESSFLPSTEPVVVHVLSGLPASFGTSSIDGQTYEKIAEYASITATKNGKVVFSKRSWRDSQGVTQFWENSSIISAGQSSFQFILVAERTESYEFGPVPKIRNPVPLPAVIRAVANSPVRNLDAKIPFNAPESKSSWELRFGKPNSAAQVLFEFLIPSAYAQPAALPDRSKDFTLIWPEEYLNEETASDSDWDNCIWFQDGVSGEISCSDFVNDELDESYWRRHFNQEWNERGTLSTVLSDLSCNSIVTAVNGASAFFAAIGSVLAFEKFAGLAAAAGAEAATIGAFGGSVAFAGVIAGAWCVGSYVGGLVQGWIHGDPHLVTFNGLRYDFQARGEFVYVVSPQIEMQQRYRGMAAGLASITVATAIRIGDHIVEVYRDDQDVSRQNLQIVLDGKPVTLGYEGLSLDDGGFIARRRLQGTVSGNLTTTRKANSLLAVAPGGSYAIVETFNRSQDVSVSLTNDAREQTSGGLGGKPDGNPSNDFWLRDGSSLQISEAETVAGLYGKFGSAWRVRPEERLFTQGNAADFLTAVHTTLPDKITRISDFDQSEIDRARQACIEAGIPEGPPMEACMYDVLASGDPSWADEMASSSIALAVAPDTGPIAAKTSPPQPVEATFMAIAEDVGAALTGPVEWTVINSETEELQVIDDQGSELTLSLVPGAYEIFATANNASGETEVEVVSGNSQRFDISLIVTQPETPFDSPTSAPAGSVLSFNWRGPNGKGDLIFIAKTSMARNRYPFNNRHETEKGPTASLVVPVIIGNYEIRYFSMANGTLLHRTPLEVTAPEVTLDSPDSIPAGTPMNFTWEGPNAPGDLWFVAATNMAATKYWTANNHPTKNGSPALMTAPAVPGDYQIRYYSMRNGTSLAYKPIKVTKSQVTIDSPRTAAAGSKITVNWSGPMSKGDRLFIIGEGTPGTKYPLSRFHHASAGSPAAFTVPATPGTYHIRYFSMANGRSLAYRVLIVR